MSPVPQGPQESLCPFHVFWNGGGSHLVHRGLGDGEQKWVSPASLTWSTQQGKNQRQPKPPSRDLWGVPPERCAGSVGGDVVTGSTHRCHRGQGNVLDRVGVGNTREVGAAGAGWPGPSASIGCCTERRAGPGFTSAPGGAGVGFGGHRRRVSLLFFPAGASGFRDASRDSGSGEGPGCSQVQVSPPPASVAGVRCLSSSAGESPIEPRLPSESGQLSHGQSGRWEPAWRGHWLGSGSPA